MNVAGMGAFAGGLAGGYQEQQNAAALNKRYGAAAGLDAARAAAITGEESRAAQMHSADLQGIQNAYQIFNDKLGPNHPTTKMFKSILSKTGTNTAPAPQAQPTGGASMGSATPSDSPNDGGQVMP